MGIPNQLTERPSKDCKAYNCPMSSLKAAMAELRAQYPMLVDLTAVDHGVNATSRFEVVWHLFNPTSHEYLRVASLCSANDTPTAPSVADLWPAADWHERECYDLMGVTFEGHPNLRRILMWEGYPYHPLRKDFPLSGIETPLPAEDIVAETGAEMIAAPMAGGPFTAQQASTMQKREPRAKDESWTEKHEKK